MTAGEIANRGVDDAAAVVQAVVERVGPGDAVVVKASRALGLEAVAEGLVAGAADRHRSGRSLR